MDPLHGLAEMRRPWSNGNDAAIIDVFAAIKLDGCVVYGVEMKSQETRGHLAGKSAGEIIDEQLDVHFAVEEAVAAKSVYV